MFDWSNCDRKSQLSGILTEPLNPREQRILELCEKYWNRIKREQNINERDIKEEFIQEN